MQKSDEAVVNGRLRPKYFSAEKQRGVD